MHFECSFWCVVNSHHLAHGGYLERDKGINVGLETHLILWLKVGLVFSKRDGERKSKVVERSSEINALETEAVKDREWAVIWWKPLYSPVTSPSGHKQWPRLRGGSILRPPTRSHKCTLGSLHFKCSEAVHGTHATSEDTPGIVVVTLNTRTKRMNWCEDRRMKKRLG